MSEKLLEEMIENSKILEIDKEYMFYNDFNGHFEKVKYIGYTKQNKYLFYVLIQPSPGYYPKRTKTGKEYHFSFTEEETKNKIASPYENKLEAMFSHWGK